MKIAWNAGEPVSCAEHGVLGAEPAGFLEDVVTLLEHYRDVHKARVHEALRKYTWARDHARREQDHPPLLREPADIAAFAHVGSIIHKVICGETFYRENGEIRTVEWQVFPTGTVICAEGWDADIEGGYITGFRRIEEKDYCTSCSKVYRWCRCSGGPYGPRTDFSSVGFGAAENFEVLLPAFR